MSKIKLYRFDGSTNVERVEMALAFKGLTVEHVNIDPDNRSEIIRLSGQDLVPVIDDKGRVVYDSPEIIRYLDWRYTAQPLFPTDPARRAEMNIFIDWFNRVWKRPPNEICEEMEKPNPDQGKIRRLGAAITKALELFEGMLTGREYLFGSFSAADCIAFPFLKYSVLHKKPEEYLFHQVLVDYQPMGDTHPNLERWIRLVDQRPRA